MIIPKPKHYKESGVLNILPCIASDDIFSSCKKAFSRIAYKVFGLCFKEGEGGIYVKHKEALAEEEYEIQGNTVFAKTKAGASYGLSTLLQLLERDGDQYLLRNTEITDKPDNAFRGLMIDLGRQFHPFETLISYVDLCYVNKIKFLQLHFTDNELWTLPLDCLPEAATKGKAYTKTELSFLVEYAKDAEIELVPEFEGIGHSAHLNAVYPNRFGNEYDTEKSSETDGAINVEATFNDNIMCIGRPTIFEDIRAMLTEIAEIFKQSKYIHVGCDEARHQNWLSCKHCRKYMKENGFASTRSMYSHFARKIIDICFSLGRTPIVWEGFPKEGSEEISRDTIVVSWENFYQTTNELLDGGFKIINASWKPLYILPPTASFADAEDLNWSVAGYDWNLYKWDNWAKFSKAYGGMEIQPDNSVIGGMLCTWSCTYEQEIKRVLKDLPALSDRTWNTTGYVDTEAFDGAVQGLLEIEKRLV
ncbi:MAG: family 20 glycosylhydrolase [Clostridia bacterium]|nr:family 20 glycosylhydrolase [Clostridia bacterium]